MDAITLLKNDHKTVEALFKRFEQAGDRALVEKRQIVDRIIEELSIHAAIEELVFYPVARATVPKTEDIALESLEEHHIVKWTLSELEKMQPGEERFDAKVTVLIENVRHHVKEEEHDLFPLVRAELGRTALNDLGESLAKAKMTAPTHPHPTSPDVPPGNMVTGAVGGVVDRIGDNISGIAQGSVSVAQDLIARILHSKKPKTSPVGSSVARKRATGVRRAADVATDGAKQTVETVKAGANKTVRATKAGAKGTVTTAQKSARSTATQAKRATTNVRHTAGAAASTTAATAKRASKKTVATAKGSRS